MPPLDDELGARATTARAEPGRLTEYGHFSSPWAVTA